VRSTRRADVLGQAEAGDDFGEAGRVVPAGEQVEDLKGSDDRGDVRLSSRSAAVPGVGRLSIWARFSG
jgi:hypothetical protein